MFDEYLEPPRVKRPVSPAPAIHAPVNSTGTPSSITIDQDAPSPNNHVAPVDTNPFINVFGPKPSCDASSSGDSLQEKIMVMASAFKPLELREDLGKLQPTADIGIFVGYAPSRKAESTLMEDNLVASVDNNPFINVFAPEPSSNASSSGDVSLAESTYVSQTPHHLDDCDVQATNIILHGLPPDEYALLNHQEVAKNIWDRVKLLMKDNELSYQECECRLYNLFDKFASIQGETCYDYNLLVIRFDHIGMDKDHWRSSYLVGAKIVNNSNPRGEGAAGYGGAQKRVGNANPGGQDNSIDEDVDEQLVQDLSLNMDNVFQADDCDAFDSDVDEAPTAQTMFMVNLSSAYPIYDEAGPSYDSDILSELHDHDHYQDAVCKHHEEHEMYDNVLPNHVVNSHADYTSDSNMISYDQYVKDNAVPGVQSNVSSVPNDAYMMIYNDMYEHHA
nr:integrase, catalytic region, zinc finger, CCHC-type, peptidase aspartic, catalytic [Tanacetum cinerariifolium]